MGIQPRRNPVGYSVPGEPSTALNGEGCGWEAGLGTVGRVGSSKRTMVTVGCRTSARVVLVAIAGMLLAACSSGTRPLDHSSATGTLSGRVTAGPTCPVERPDTPCPPRPVVAEVQARQVRRVVASGRSGRDGSYRLRLPAGTYTLVVVTPSPFPRCTPRTVTVIAGRVTDGDLGCDTGIR